MNQSDDSQREKQAMEHQDTATVEKEIRGVGNNGLSSMRSNLVSLFRTPLENAVYNERRGVSNGSPSLHDEAGRLGGMPSGHRGEAEYVRLYNVANPTTEFAMTLCKLWLDAIGTPKEEHWFNAYDLYIDRVIFNPNI